MRIKARSTLNAAEPGTSRAAATFPTFCVLADGSFLASYSIGSTKDSGLGLFGNYIKDITDGTSNTIMIMEDSSRPANIIGAYVWTTKTVGGAPGVDATQSPGTGGESAPNRWADPDVGSGVSGPPTQDPSSPLYVAGSIIGPINNNKSPLNGPATCPWTTNNCGPNDEPFSQHFGGCHAVMADGSVRWLNENMDIHLIRRLCDRADGEILGDF